MVYGEVAQTGSSATVGVQQGTGAQFTQYECNTAGTVKQRSATGVHRAAMRIADANSDAYVLRQEARPAHGRRQRL
jgi:hypothetical protein